MTNRTRDSFRARAAAMAIVGLCLGCLPVLAKPIAGVPAKEGAAPEAPDPRALLALDQLEPSVTVPRPNPEVQPLSDRCRQQIAKARALIADQRYTEAAIELERALRSDANRPEIDAVLAELHWQAGNIDRAKTHATRAVDAAPYLAAPHYVLGRTKAKAAENAGALYEFRVALVCSDLEDNPDMAALTRYHLADVLATERYSTAALAQYDAFDEVAARLRGAQSGRAPSVELAAILASPAKLAERRAQLLASLDRFDQAASTLEPVVKAQPQNAQFGVLYAELLLKAGRIEEAFHAAQAIRSNEDRVISLLFDISAKSTNPRDAEAEINRRLAEDPNDAALALRFAKMLEELGRIDEAADTLDRFLKDHAEAHAVRMRLIPLRIKQNSEAEAFRLAADAIRKNPDAAAEVAATLTAQEEATLARLMASAQQPGDFADHYLVGALSAKTKGSDVALEAFAKCAEANPAFLPGRVALAQIHFDRYDYDKALTLLPATDGSELGNAQSELLAGRIQDRLDQFTKAEEHYRKAAQLARDDPTAKFALAEMYYRTGDNDLAQRQLATVVQQHPDHEDARELLGLTYWNQKKNDLAIAEFRELAKRTKNPATAARCKIIENPDLRSNPAAGRTMLLEAVKDGTQDASAWLAVAATYGEKELPEQRQAFQNALTVEPDREDALLGLVRVAQLELAFEASADYLEKLIRRRPNRLEWRRSLVDLKLILRDFDAALALSKNLVDRPNLDDRELANCRFTRIRAMVWAGHDDQVLTQLREWIAADPDDLNLTAALAGQLLSQEKFAEAIDLYAQLHSQNAGDRGLRISLISALVEAKLHDRAAQHCLDWLGEDPQDDQTVQLLLSSLAAAGQVDDAVALAKERMLRPAGRQIYQDWLLRQLVMSKRLEDAVEVADVLVDTTMRLLREASQRGQADVSDVREDELIYYPDGPFSPDRLQARLYALRVGAPTFRRPSLIGILLQAGHFRRAADLLDDWLNEPNDPRIRQVYLKQLGTAHQFAGRRDKATEAFGRALVLESNSDIDLKDDIGLKNDLAYMWIDSGERLSDAEPMIRHALGRNPDQAAYLDTYGWLLYKKGDFAGAVEWLLRGNAARLEEDPVILDHLGDANWRLGKKEESVAFWEKASERLAKQTEQEILNPDERRVKKEAPLKVEAAKTDATPQIAPLAGQGQPDAAGHPTRD